ncbi:MAG: hypothetical protein Fur0041_19270 [Bacteroidia bacterium]
MAIKKKTTPKSKTAAKKAPLKKKAKTPARKATGSKASSVKAKTSKPRKALRAAPKQSDESFMLAQTAIDGILDKKGVNIRFLDLREIENAVTDYFIICEGNSNIQVEAIADSVEDLVKKKTGQRPYRSEGWENAQWILIDYIDVVVHVFQPDTRHFYNLESLWADAKEIPVKE